MSLQTLKRHITLHGQKFEIRKEEVRISKVFQAVEKAKSSLKVFAWGFADTTLEDVFIKVPLCPGFLMRFFSSTSSYDNYFFSV